MPVPDFLRSWQAFPQLVQKPRHVSLPGQCRPEDQPFHPLNHYWGTNTFFQLRMIRARGYKPEKDLHPLPIHQADLRETKPWTSWPERSCNIGAKMGRSGFAPPSLLDCWHSALQVKGASVFPSLFLCASHSRLQHAALHLYNEGLPVRRGRKHAHASPGKGEGEKTLHGAWCVALHRHPLKVASSALPAKGRVETPSPFTSAASAPLADRNLPGPDSDYSARTSLTPHAPQSCFWVYSHTGSNFGIRNFRTCQHPWFQYNCSIFYIRLRSPYITNAVLSGITVQSMYGETDSVTLLSKAQASISECWYKKVGNITPFQVRKQQKKLYAKFSKVMAFFWVTFKYPNCSRTYRAIHLISYVVKSTYRTS